MSDRYTRTAPGAAEHLHLGDTGHHRETLCEICLPVFVQIRQRHTLGRQRKIENRLVRRIDLPIRRRQNAERKAAERLRYRRLYVSGGSVDIPIERELNRDTCRSELARRRHVVDAGDGRELLFERRCNGRRHGLRTRARKVGVNRDLKRPSAGRRREFRTRRCRRTEC